MGWSVSKCFHSGLVLANTKEIIDSLYHSCRTPSAPYSMHIIRKRSCLVLPRSNFGGPRAQLLSNWDVVPCPRLRRQKASTLYAYPRSPPNCTSRSNQVRHESPNTNGPDWKWAVILTEFDVVYVPQRAIKGQALADFLAAHPILDDSSLITELPNEEVFASEDIQPHWEMYFDGASHLSTLSEGGAIRRRVRADVVFRTPQDGVLYHSYSLLKQNYSNNEAEYEALVIGLALALNMGITHLYAFEDSQLVV